VPSSLTAVRPPRVRPASPRPVPTHSRGGTDRPDQHHAFLVPHKLDKLVRLSGTLMLRVEGWKPKIALWTRYVPATGSLGLLTSRRGVAGPNLGSITPGRRPRQRWTGWAANADCLAPHPWSPGTAGRCVHTPKHCRPRSRHIDRDLVSRRPRRPGQTPRAPPCKTTGRRLGCH
jgi:hypothetical protein